MKSERFENHICHSPPLRVAIEIGKILSLLKTQKKPLYWGVSLLTSFLKGCFSIFTLQLNISDENQSILILKLTPFDREKENFHNLIFILTKSTPLIS
jgi:hypothetical protein